MVTLFSSVHITYYLRIAIKHYNIPLLIKRNKNSTVKVFRNKLDILTYKNGHLSGKLAHKLVYLYLNDTENT